MDDREIYEYIRRIVNANGFKIVPGTMFIRPRDGLICLLVELDVWRPYSDYEDLNYHLIDVLGRRVYLDRYEEDYIESYRRLYCS